MALELEPQRLKEPEIVDKLKQYQITLPDGTLVPAQGEKNSRILSSLVASFQENQSGVSTKELLALDISSGITGNEEKRSLYNSIHRLRIRTLMGTGWNVITVIDKKGKRNPKGIYCLAKTISKTTENPSMKTLILTDGKTAISLHPRPKKMLQGIIDSKDKGMTTEELQQPHIDAGTSTKTARYHVHDDLTSIRAALNGTPFTIVNLTPKADHRRGKGGRYVFKPKSAIIDNPKQNGTSVLPEAVETTIFAANGDADSVAQSPSGDSQDEENEDEDSPQGIEEARQNTLKKQARLQLALNILNSVRNGKLGTLNKDAVAYIQNSLPPGITEPDAKGFIIESINAGLKYWNLNEWDLGPNPSAQQTGLVETCRKLRIGSRYAREKVTQEIWTHFSLPQDPFTSSPAPQSPKDTTHS